MKHFPNMTRGQVDKRLAQELETSAQWKAMAMDLQALVIEAQDGGFASTPETLAKAKEKLVTQLRDAAKELKEEAAQ